VDIHGKSVNMDMDMDGKFHIHGKPDCLSVDGVTAATVILLLIIIIIRTFM